MDKTREDQNSTGTRNYAFCVPEASLILFFALLNAISLRVRKRPVHLPASPGRVQKQADGENEFRNKRKIIIHEGFCKRQ